MLVAVYGTLRAGFGNHSLLGDSPLVGVGRTVREFTMLAAGFPVCLVDADDAGLPPTQVVVEVYDTGAASSPASIIRRLDNLEGHPDWYERKEIQVVLESGDEVTAWMYLMPGTRDDFPSWTYVPNGDFKEFRRAHGW
jgi:gamma-glutamylcyclotransferase (GGCT)/AIG2-like uncharacterized protein YtfP